MEQKEEEHAKTKPNHWLEIISNGTTAIACASGGALLGTTIAGPVVGIAAAIVSGVAGFLISGSHSAPAAPPHDK
jgi:hypothetical protein